jgi:hypothetical protein
VKYIYAFLVICFAGASTLCSPPFEYRMHNKLKIDTQKAKAEAKEKEKKRKENNQPAPPTSITP